MNFRRATTDRVSTDRARNYGTAILGIYLAPVRAIFLCANLSMTIANELIAAIFTDFDPIGNVARRTFEGTVITIFAHLRWIDAKVIPTSDADAHHALNVPSVRALARAKQALSFCQWSTTGFTVHGSIVT